MNDNTENLPMPQLTQEQQDKIVAAVLDQLNPVSLSVKLGDDDYTLRKHLEIAIADSIGTDSSIDAVIRLLQRMQDAALGILCSATGVSLADYDAVLDERDGAVRH